jgi:hypothetical protein
MSTRLWQRPHVLHIWRFSPNRAFQQTRHFGSQNSARAIPDSSLASHGECARLANLSIPCAIQCFPAPASCSVLVARIPATPRMGIKPSASGSSTSSRLLLLLPLQHLMPNRHPHPCPSHDLFAMSTLGRLASKPRVPMSKLSPLCRPAPARGGVLPTTALGARLQQGIFADASLVNVNEDFSSKDSEQIHYLQRCPLLWELLISSSAAPLYDSSNIWEGSHLYLVIAHKMAVLHWQHS